MSLDIIPLITENTNFDVLIKLLLVEVIHDRIFKFVFIFLTKSSVVRQKREIREYVLHNDEKNNTMKVTQMNELNLAFKISLSFFNTLKTNIDYLSTNWLLGNSNFVIGPFLLAWVFMKILLRYIWAFRLCIIDAFQYVKLLFYDTYQLIGAVYKCYDEIHCVIFQNLTLVKLCDKVNSLLSILLDIKFAILYSKDNLTFFTVFLLHKRTLWKLQFD